MPASTIHAPLGHMMPGSFNASEFITIAKSSADPLNESAAATKKSRQSHARSPKKLLQSTLKICCLGFFVIRRDGTIPIGISGTTLPGMLLRLLLASGPRGIGKMQAESILWPDKETATTRGLIDSTIYRLRQLLDCDASFRIEHGKIAIDGNIVSIDAWLFDSEADSLLSRLYRADDTESGEVAVRLERLLELYRGPFLATDNSLTAIVQTRDRLQAKFAQVIERGGQYWQSVGRWDRATQLYEHGLASDNVSEHNHRQIIRCHLAQGQFADAIRAFNRCRELLDHIIGVAPSEETVALYRHALLGRESDGKI